MLPTDSTQQSLPWRRFVALGCVAALLLLGLFAVRPDLHAHVHADAHEDSHGCAIDLFAHGLTLAGTAVDVAGPLSRAGIPDAEDGTVWVPAVARRQPPGRGPPSDKTV